MQARDWAEEAQALLDGADRMAESAFALMAASVHFHHAALQLAQADAAALADALRRTDPGRAPGGDGQGAGR